MPLKQVLIVDQDLKLVFSNILKDKPVLCKEHNSHLRWLQVDKKNSFYCEKGEHSITYDPQQIELVEL